VHHLRHRLLVATHQCHPLQVYEDDWYHGQLTLSDRAFESSKHAPSQKKHFSPPRH
jgi:hypothetical protein